MASITRWSHAHCLKPESVLEHSAFVALFSLKLAYKYELDIGHILQKAILHDIEEVITGDIPTTTKYANPSLEAEIAHLEIKAAQKVSREVFSTMSYHFWLNAKDESDEGRVVLLADMAAVVYKIWVEKELGNENFLRYLNGIIERISDSIDNLPGFLKPEAEALLVQARSML